MPQALSHSSKRLPQREDLDRRGQVERKTAFYVRVGNGTREITDETERHRYIASRWRSGALPGSGGS